MATAAEIQTAYRAIYRTDLNATVAQAIANSGITVDAYVAQQLPQVAATTQAAVAIASFVTGTAPTSAKLDELKVAADAQVASYTALGSSNPQLGAYEAFGRSFATDSTTTAGFNTKYGALSTSDFVAVVYAQVYGTQPSAGAAANLTAQINYFTNLYTVNGVANASLAAKGAVLGQIVGYAFTSSASANSTLDNQVQSLLTSAAKGDTTVYSKALPTVVDPGTAGVTITLQAATNEVSTTAADPAFKTTANNDTINGAINAASTIGNDTKIAAGDGIDSLKITIDTTATGTNADATYKPSASTISSVENIFVKSVEGAGKATVVDLENVSGVQQVWLDTGSVNATGTTTFQNFDSAATVGLKAVANPVTIDYTGTSATTATITVDGLYTGAVTITDTGVKTANVTTVGSSTNSLNFADNDLETVTVKGSGSFSTTAIGTGLKTFDASGVGTFTNANFTGATFANKGVFTLGAGSDTIELDALKAHTVNVGTGNDTVEVNVAVGGNNLSADAISTAAKLSAAVLTANGLGFSSNTADSFRLDVASGTPANTRVNLSQTQIDNANAAGDLKAAVTVVAAATTTGAESVAVFKFGGDSYVYYDGAGNGLDANDALIKLTGVDFATLSFTGATQNFFLV